MREGQPLPYTVKSQRDTAGNKEIANNRELGATIKIIAVRLSWLRMQEGYAQGAGGYGIRPYDNVSCGLSRLVVRCGTPRMSSPTMW